MIDLASQGPDVEALEASKHIEDRVKAYIESKGLKVHKIQGQIVREDSQMASHGHIAVTFIVRAEIRP